MPFGLKNAAHAFQRLMDTVFHNVDCVFVSRLIYLQRPLVLSAFSILLYV